MQFNQQNNNRRDVNNAVAERGNVTQTLGVGNRVAVDQPKDSLWSMLWKRIKAVGKWLLGYFNLGKK